MATRTIDADAPIERRSVGSRFLDRQLPHYPATRARIGYLAIVVAVTVVLYYQLYIPGAVAPSILQDLHMSFKYFVYISVVGNAIGAFSSLIAGLADRWGRANLVVYGVGITSVLVAFVLPNMGSKLGYLLIFALISFVEGIILVATPALVRDFSPQLGRASAMGFWTLGPVLGSLAVAVVSTNTLDHLHAWQDQFVISGVAGLVIFALALLFLKELAPPLRDQLMVSMHDRVLIEAKAKGLDIEASLRHPWKQVLKPRIVGSAFGISVFLLFYYAAVGFFVIYLTTTFGFSEHQANSLGNWYWGFNALALLLVGIASDKLRVRKPFMIFGAVGAIVMTIIFLGKASHPQTSYHSLVLIVTISAVFQGIAYAPWMASFTENVEEQNPALTATGLAVWGWIIRIVVAVSAFFLPLVVTAATPLATYGAQVKTLSTTYQAQLTTISQVDPASLAALQKNPADAAAGLKAVGEIATKAKVAPAEAITRLQAVGKVPKADLAFLQAHGVTVQKAAARNASEWKRWWWVAVGGQVAFALLVFIMTGPWSPKRAKAKADEHERLVEEELARMNAAEPTATAPTAPTAPTQPA